MPLFIVDGLGEEPAMAGVALACFAAGNVAAILVAGRLSDVYGRRTIMLPGLAITTVGTVLLGYSPNLLVALGLSAVAGIGSGLFAPTHQAALADVLGNRQQGGSALAAFGMASDLGAVSGPILVGFIAAQWGFGPAFVATGVVSAAAFILWLFARETAPAAVPPDPHLTPVDPDDPDATLN